ncbi:MAG: NCS2 family permease [Bradymonadales bacterium]|nr:NCS2 family permease [Bradymonadales bacterium]
MSILERCFKLQDNGTTVGHEVRGGITTFLTMCYIIFVQPAIMSAAGMPALGVMMATCLSCAFATFVMAFTANYPIALAPAMGHNAFFAFTICLTMGFTWQQALAANCISGLLFLGLSFVGFRERLLNAVPLCLKHGIAVGIGLLIAVLGLEWSGLIVASPATYVTRGDLGSPAVIVSGCGLFIMAILLALRVQGALLIGLLATAIIGWLAGIVQYHGIVSTPSGLGETAFQLSFSGLASHGIGSLLAIIFVLFFLDLFDTIGTLIGVADQAGFLKPDGTLPRARGALLADATGTVFGTLMGTSTVTSYIESSTGVASGARTGLANLVTGGLFLLALFFSPLVATIAAPFPIAEGVLIYPVIAPVLILVGLFMIRGVVKIQWEDLTEAIPAFLALAIMPLSFSITEGIAVGFVSYSLLKLVTRRWREAHWLVHLFSLLFVARYILLGLGWIGG